MDPEHRAPGVTDDLGRDGAQPGVESLDEQAHRLPHRPLIDLTVGLEPGLLVVPRQIAQEPKRGGPKSSETGHRSIYGFQNPCDGMRNARLKREDEFSHAMIIVSSAMVSSS
jgi:hypothetical protein